ncbi:dihydropteroate synthase [bacterium]|nr:dihydropteroate synthase [bacterium]
MNEKNFLLKKVCQKDIQKELELINFDNSYIFQASNKYKFLNIKIFSLSLPQANILKQTALSAGADCAVSRGVLTSQVDKTDCILGGSFSQIKKIIDAIRYQQFSMSELAKGLDTFLNNCFENREPKIVGILNLTKNSFSDGGKYYDFDNAVAHLNEMIDEGADMIDIGAESTKPYSAPVSPNEQLEKIEPILKYINNRNINVPISIDTRSAIVAERSIDLGAAVINDVSGLEFDKNMSNVIAQNDVRVIIQHSQGTPENMQQNPKYVDVVNDVFNDLYCNIKKAQNSGIKKENIIIDVGIGFGKTREQNFELIKRIDEFCSLECEIMLGLSRKSLLNMPDASNDEKDIYSLALNTLALERNVDYLRVHNVKLHRRLVDLMKVYKEA